MRKVFFLGLMVLASLSSCKKNETSSSKKPVILTIDGVEVPTADFEYVYNKNNANSENAYSKQSLEEYLKLYTNFKLKVMEAEAMGLDTTKAFRSELEGYRRQLAQPYMTEKNVTDSLIREAYDRMKTEVNASHILLTVSPDAEPADTLKAYNEILALRKRAQAGESFEDLAGEYSQDPSAKNNSGDLGYFTALQMVYPFEEAAYTTPKGKVSQPFRTRFGYHILKVKDTRPSQGRVRVSHIMIRTNPGMSAKDSVAAEKRIGEIKSKLDKGEAWDKVVLQFSEDQNSKEKGGMLPEFGTNSMLPGFEKAAFVLEKPGDISEPFNTPYGWHIIRLEEKIALQDFDKMQADLRARVGKDSRSSINQQYLLQRLKKENDFEEEEGNLEYALALADTNVFTGTIQVNRQTEVMKKELFEIEDIKYTVADFLEYMNTQPRAQRDISPKHYMSLQYPTFRDISVIKYEEAHLTEKYPEYRMLLGEYKDGILLFQLMDEKVWSKAVKDTTGLREYFQGHRDEYRWDERATMEIIDAKDEVTLNKVTEAAKAGKFIKKDAGFVPFNFQKGTSDFTSVDSAKVKVFTAKMRLDTTLFVKIIGTPENKKADGVKMAQTRVQKIMDALVSNGIDKGRFLTEMKPADPKMAATPVTFEVYTTSLTALEPEMNRDNPLDVKITEGIFQKKDMAVLQKVPMEKGTHEVKLNDRVFRVNIVNVLQPTKKTFEEAKGLVISDYQNHLENQWLDELRKKYPLTVNQNEVDRLVMEHQ